MRLLLPVPASRTVLSRVALAEDLSSCMAFGSAGVGEKAVYLGTLMMERRRYVAYGDIERIYKRIAMTKGGFTGRGAFASAAYIVVELDDGRSISSFMKREEDVDRLIARVREIAPDLAFMSREAEQRLNERQRERESKRIALGPCAEEAISSLEKQKSFLEEHADICSALSNAARRKRADDLSNPKLRWIATLIVVIGAVCIVWGCCSMAADGLGDGLFLMLFGFAAAFLFSGLSVIPTGRRSTRAIAKDLEHAIADAGDCIAGYPGFVLPAWCCHPAALAMMIRIIEDGRAETAAEAFSLMADDLAALDSTCVVSSDEYVMVMAVKPLFLVHGNSSHMDDD